MSEPVVTSEIILRIKGLPPDSADTIARKLRNIWTNRDLVKISRVDREQHLTHSMHVRRKSY